MKKIGTFIIAFLQVTLCAAQFAVGKSTGQEMVETAVKNSFFISKQSFQLSDKKSGELFGLNGKDEFGTQYSLGVKTSNGYILTDKAIRPWKYNDMYAKYKEGYSPIPFSSSYTELWKSPKYLDIPIEHPFAQKDSSVYIFNSETFEGKGIAIDNSKGEKNGWIILVTIGKDADFEQNASVNLCSVKNTVKIEDAVKAIDIEKPKLLSDSIIGGIFVVPQYAEIGTVKFLLCGILVPNADKWQLICPFNGMKFDGNACSKDKKSENVSTDRSKVDDAYALTPVKDKKAKKKKKSKQK